MQKDTNDLHELTVMIDEVGFALENAMLLPEIEEHLKNLPDERTVGLTTGNDQLQREIA